MTRGYEVEGMSCEHCVAAVREEVGALDGVESVAVELRGGRLEVAGSGFSDEAVAAAVAAAGYRLAGAR